MENRRKLKHSKINDGKEFVMPIPTVKSYEKYMEELAELEKESNKGLDTDEFSKLANKYMLLHLLREVDDSITMSTIDEMHPMDYQIFMEECGKVYNKGSEMSTGDDKKN